LAKEVVVVDLDQARQLLHEQRADVERALGGVNAEQRDARDNEADADIVTDAAAPMDAETVDDALAVRLQDKLAAIDRALKRVEDGSYGRSIRSGDVIPDARLEADPTAELTVEEAAAAEDAQR
jgi:DnaK suppressor protein